MATNRLTHVDVFIEEKQVIVTGVTRPSRKGFHEVKHVGIPQKALSRYYARGYIIKPVSLRTEERRVLACGTKCARNCDPSLREQLRITIGSHLAVLRWTEWQGG